MREWRKKILTECVLGVLLARAAVGNFSPVCMAYFASCFVERQARAVLFVAISIGIATRFDPVTLFRYMSVMGLLYLTEHMLQKRNLHIKRREAAWMTGIASLLLAVVQYMFIARRVETFAFMLLECILIVGLTHVFSEAVEYLLYAEPGQPMDNEQTISLVILLVFAVYGVPVEGPAGFSPVHLAVYFLLLYMGYSYGAATGALCGAGCGLLTCLMGGDSRDLGVLCLLGICAGSFRGLKRTGVCGAFVVTDMVLGYLFENSYVGAGGFREVLLAAVFFTCIPGKLVVKADTTSARENMYGKDNMQSRLQEKLSVAGKAFENLAKNFQENYEPEGGLSRQDMLQVFDDLSEEVCATCNKKEDCWKNHYYDTYGEALLVLAAAREGAVIGMEDLSGEFAGRCIRKEEFLREMNIGIGTAKNRHLWRNKMMETRNIIAEQFGEVAGIVSNMAEEVFDVTEKKEMLQGEEEQRIAKSLARIHVKIRKCDILHHKNGRIEVFLEARTDKRYCVMAKDAAQIISEITDVGIIPAEETKTVIPKEYSRLRFVEAVNFKVLHGLARTVKRGEKTSGDNYSFLDLGGEKMLMLLSDGMGSGLKACLESEGVIEMLENFMEAGFREDSSLRLINSMMVLGQERQSFTTVDMAVFDRYTGLCRFVKNGAAATFLCRKDEITVVNSDTLPIGVLKNAPAAMETIKLYSGDMIIMVTDGVLDSLNGQDKEEQMVEIIRQVRTDNAQELAERILKQALCQTNYPLDDMTVLVAGIWENPALSRWAK